MSLFQPKTLRPNADVPWSSGQESRPPIPTETVAEVKTYFVELHCPKCAGGRCAIRSRRLSQGYHVHVCDGCGWIAALKVGPSPEA